MLPSPLGTLTLLSDGSAITGLRLSRQVWTAPTSCSNVEAPILQEAARWLDCYWSGQSPGPPPPLHPAGTPFQLAVWDLLRQLPYGRSCTYGDLSRELQCRGLASSPQAVGQALGRNPILLLLPCHRVLGRGRTLSGYAAGPEAKRFLLTLEGIPFHC